MYTIDLFIAPFIVEKAQVWLITLMYVTQFQGLAIVHAGSLSKLTETLEIEQ